MSKIKKIFNNPKKAVISTFCAVAVVASLGTCTLFTAGAVANSSAIGEKNAQNFAFADAGVDPASAKLSKTKFEFEHGQFVYDVEFVANGTEYEYLIKSTDGTVIKKNIEIKNHPVADETSKAPTKAPTKDSAKASSITKEQAKEIALKDAGLKASDVKFTKQKLDNDDGRQVYEIEFIFGNMEYEYDIKAADGKILDKSVENIRTGKEVKPTVENKTDKVAPTKAEQPTNAQQPTKAQDSKSNVIGVDGAKKKALANAGVAESAAKFIKQKLEYDDGVQVYDIEFVTSDYKYEYEINARTGAIRDKDVERFKPVVATTQSTKVNKTEKSGSYIGIDKAKSIAVARAGLSISDVTFMKAKLDREDGRVVYEVEFCKNRMEYECTVNAVTGAIIDFDAELDD